MTDSHSRSFRLPLEHELGQHRLTSSSDLQIGVLPNGCLFAIEHVAGEERTLLNQVFGSPLGSGIGRLLLRVGAERKAIAIAGPGAEVSVGGAGSRFVWTGETDRLRHRVTLWLHPREPLWLWRVELENTSFDPVECDAMLIQDLGLGARGMVLANEAYTSQYVDHTVCQHERFGPVIMSRQNMAQFGRNPWVAHGCLEGAASFATDALPLFGPAFRKLGERTPGFGANLPAMRLQHEAACAAVQSQPVSLAPGGRAARSFFALFEPHHPQATSDADLRRLEQVERAARDFQPAPVPVSAPARSILETAAPLAGEPLTPAALDHNYPKRLHEERRDGELLSFFTPDGPQNRHVALAAKERLMRRRHGAILRSGEALLPEENGLSVTCWMHGVFAAQLTIGNTALHKLFSVSRDPYNITRASGLRILADRGSGWQLLTVPSLFEIGLNDCRWLYQFEDGAIAVHALASPQDPAMSWHITSTGRPCRFLVFGHAVLGEHEFRHPGLVEIDPGTLRISFRPDPDWIWGQHYRQAVHHLVTSTPDAVEALGSGALLFEGKAPRSADAYAAIKTRPTHSFSFALVGTLDDAEKAGRLADDYENGAGQPDALTKARAFWSRLTRDWRFAGEGALDTIFPWFCHDALVHLSVPRGLEQYSAAAWGTRDVCQGPVELLLPLGHHGAVREILRIVYAQQSETAGDWPQWFMLDPYRQIRDQHSHGDVIVWPLKALCDYLEETGDFGFLAEPLPWTAEDFSLTARRDPLAAHVEKQLATIKDRFIAGTHLIRYGLGDWNDALQPVDPEMRDWMVSSWTVALLYQQLGRYAALLHRHGQEQEAEALSELAAAMREDVNRLLMPDGTLAGYTLLHKGAEPEWLLHPRDGRTGVHYSLIGMTRSIIGGLFTPEQAQHHLAIIGEHLLYPDGARLMDRPVTYRGGIEVIFRRAESAAFFGREIGLMYGHSQLRWCEALGMLGDADAARAGLRLLNPITVTEVLPNASLRQRNAYFSSSDADFADRYAASAEWERVKEGTIALDGGWRVYSSGPGLFVRLALQLAQRRT
jgi:cellobiose phosphorylase